MVRRHEISDEQWSKIKELLPGKLDDPGRTGEDNRGFINAVLWIARTGAPWRDLPERLGPWGTVYHHFAQWRREGIFDEILKCLQIRLDDRGLIDWDLWCIDGANVRAARAATGADKKVSSGTPTNRRTTLWAAAEAGLDRNSTWLLTAAALPSRSRSRPVSAQLGERFLRFRPKPGGRANKTRRAIANQKTKAMRDELAKTAYSVLIQEPSQAPIVSDDISEALVHLADFLSRARSEVSRNKHGAVEYVPAIEVGTRVGKALKKLAKGIAMARGESVVSQDVYRIIKRVAVDSIPSMRARLLRILWQRREDFHNTAEIADAGELATHTARIWLDDLRLLEIVDRRIVSKNAHAWRLRADFTAVIAGAGFHDDVVVGGSPPESYFHAESDPEVHGGKNPTPTPTTKGNSLFDNENGDFESEIDELADAMTDSEDALLAEACLGDLVEVEAKAGVTIPAGWTPLAWASNQERLAMACENVRPDRAAELSRQAAAIRRAMGVEKL